MSSIKLPRHVINKLLTLAQAKDQQEVCGLISQNSDGVLKLFPITNISTNASRFFEMDPKETIQAMKTIRNEDCKLFAIYHSHPTAPAFPSKIDIEKAGYPDALYLIISLNTKGVLELKGFILQQDTINTVDLIL